MHRISHETIARWSIQHDGQSNIVMENMMKREWNRLAAGMMTGASLILGAPALASSHKYGTRFTPSSTGSSRNPAMAQAVAPTSN
ncbi:MAG: hypothetical protein AAF637_21800, partial [Pseudomonadota bacterium]